MPRSPLTYLLDIDNAAKIIIELTREKNLDDYLADIGLRSAVERQLITVGEALSQMAAHFPHVAERIPDYRSIINFRHFLVHGYREIRNQAVWGIVETRLPSLIAIVVSLKSELED